MKQASPRVVRGPYHNGVKRRKEILESATRVFAQLGYSGGSLRTIAAQVGSSPATLIQHFGSKEGLLQAVLEDWNRQVGVVVPEELRGLAYIQATRRYMRFHVKHRGLIELFITFAAEASDPLHPARDFIQRRYAESVEMHTTRFREARDDGEIEWLPDVKIETEVRSLIAILDGLELQWLLDSSVDLIGLFDEYLSLAVARWQRGVPGRQ